MATVLYDLYWVVSDLLAYWSEYELLPDWTVTVICQRFIICLIIFPSLSYVGSRMGDKFKKST